MTNPTVAVIIPALNEEETIARVVEMLAHRLVARIYVVDNGSTDRTAARAHAAGARVVSEPRRGYGRAVFAGVQAVTEDVVVTIDADLSDRPELLDAVLAPLLAGHADLVLGSRTRGEVMPGAFPPQQRLGNLLVTVAIRGLYGVRLSDIGPFRAIRRDRLLALDMREMTYGWPVEMVVKAIRAGYRLAEVPVGCRPRAAGRSKVAGTLRGTILAAYHLLATAVCYARWSPPMPVPSAHPITEVRP